VVDGQAVKAPLRCWAVAMTPELRVGGLSASAMATSTIEGGQGGGVRRGGWAMSEGR
jgi:hypothetical protein